MSPGLAFFLPFWSGALGSAAPPAPPLDLPPLELPPPLVALPLPPLAVPPLLVVLPLPPPLVALPLPPPLVVLPLPPPLVVLPLPPPLVVLPLPPALVVLPLPPPLVVLPLPPPLVLGLPAELPEPPEPAGAGSLLQPRSPAMTVKPARVREVESTRTGSPNVRGYEQRQRELPRGQLL